MTQTLLRTIRASGTFLILSFPPVISSAAHDGSNFMALSKNRSWSPEIHRGKEWEKLKLNQRRRSISVDAASEFDVTDDDITELRACFELGFGLDPSNELDPRLKRAFPAFELYVAVNRQFYNRDLSRSSSMESDYSSTSDCSTISLVVDPSDDPKRVKMRLKQWAQVVACSIYEAWTHPTIK